LFRAYFYFEASNGVGLGNFLIVLPTLERPDAASAVFRAGVERAEPLLGLVPNDGRRADWFEAASFSRFNGTGSPIASDDATGSWLAALGVWFHADGFATGEEGRLLGRYLRDGARSLALSLDGSYVAVVADGRTREVSVITDIIGNSHCYWRSTERGLAISGSALLLASLEDFHLDPIAYQEFIATGIIYEDRTLFREVRKFGPGAITRFAAGELKPKVERYWSPASVKAESLGGKDATRRVWEELSLAARRISKRFPRIVCDLTGGYDSRFSAAAYHAAGVRLAATVSGPPNSGDVRVSKGLAKMAGFEHLYLEAPTGIAAQQLRNALRLTDGEYELVEYSRIEWVHETLAARFDASANGCLGEVARGNWWEILMPHVGARQPLDARMVAAKRYVAKPYDGSVFRAGEKVNLVEHFAGVVGRTTADLAGSTNTMQLDATYILMRMQSWQGRIASSTNRIWPAVTMFLFRPVLETLLSVRARDRANSNLVRGILAEYAPDWANYPLESGFPAAPMTVGNFWRFAPTVNYYGKKVAAKLLKGAVWGTPGWMPAERMRLLGREEIRGLLNPNDMRVAGVLDAGGLAEFLRRGQLADFAFDEEWGRILSLEITLRTLEQNGARLVL
jgi:hypothetical protein